MKLIVTAGATREPIDAVRFLSNISSGATGAALAEFLAAKGHEVILLRGTGSLPAKEIVPQEIFGPASDLASRLQRHLSAGTFDGVIMSAAVSDYRPSVARPGKISSDADELTLTLMRNEKILPQLKNFSRRPLKVIGFKLTADANAGRREAAVAKQFAAGGVDAVIHNDLAEIRGAPPSGHPFRFFRSASALPQEIAGTAALAEALHVFLRGDT